MKDGVRSHNVFLTKLSTSTDGCVPGNERSGGEIIDRSIKGNTLNQNMKYCLSLKV